MTEERDVFPSDNDFTFDPRTDTRNEIVFGGKMMDIARDLRLELFPTDKIVSKQELVEQVFLQLHAILNDKISSTPERKKRFKGMTHEEMRQKIEEESIKRYNSDTRE